MNDTPYQNRELDEKFANLGLLIREKHDDTMVKVNEVVVQTTKTNGRVKWLEKMIWLAIGFCTCISMVLLPFLLILFKTRTP
jgi:hypothetical protein